jgi:hypothetical protein
VHSIGVVVVCFEFDFMAAAWAAWSVNGLCVWCTPLSVHSFVSTPLVAFACKRSAQPDANGQNQCVAHTLGQKGLPFISILTDTMA